MEITIRGYIHDKGFKKELDKVLRKYPGFVEIDFCANDFRGKKYHGTQKLIIYAYYWRGELTGVKREIYARYYKPNQ